MTNPIPQEALLQHIAVLGKTGSGKTSTAKLIVEQLVADGDRVCILDPIKSDWWGLTSSADGKSEGLPFHILGGPRGHVPLHSSAGKAIGEIVASGALPLSIIDMADFEAGGLQRFFVDFAPTLLRKMRGVLYLVIEEGHEFAPKEKAGIGDENMAIYWAKKLATAGRSKGIRMIVATQRTQALHNAILGSCDTMIMHRLTAPADQEPVKKWLKANVDKETMVKVESSLASLPTGTAWICSGEARMFEQVTFPRIKTFDNTATPTKGSGVQKVKTAQVDQDKLRAIIGDAVKDAEANDPTRLKAEIARLNRELAKKPAPAHAVDPKAVEEAEQRGYERGKRVGAEDGWFQCYGQVRDTIAGLEMPDRAPLPKAGTYDPAKPAPRPEAPKPAQIKSEGSAELSSGAKALLDIAVRRYPARFSWTQICTLNGTKSRGGHFNTCRKSLIEAGLVVDAGGVVEPTDEAFDLIGIERPARMGADEMRALWLEALPGPADKMLAALIERTPQNPCTVETLGEILGMAPRGGHWNTGMRMLKDNDLITVQSGMIAPAAHLWTEKSA